MTLVVCLDDQLGMMFNNRRQSRDRILLADLVQALGDKRLLVTPYTAPLFEELSYPVLAVEDPCDLAGNDDFCFIETENLLPSTDKVTSIVIYRWNVCYPADEFFRTDMRAFSLQKRTFFAGFSHKTITKEVWTR